jgi:hypothetical protein
MPPPSVESIQQMIEAIPTIPSDAPTHVISVEREVGPYYLPTKEQLTEFFKEMRTCAYYNGEIGMNNR